MKEKRIRKVVVVGGGSAGWLMASLLASRFCGDSEQGLGVLLIESPGIPTLGVGEGTWPSMRSTLKKIGISEKEFINTCDASFKQGSKFIDWKYGSGEFYYHPFHLPISSVYMDYLSLNSEDEVQKSYADLLCPQVLLEKTHQAPKLMTSGEYSFLVNYGYHLDANKFGMMLMRHAVGRLGVEHVIDTVNSISSDTSGYITSISTENNGVIEGDLFIDCSGFLSVLMKGHYNIPFISQRDILFNDSALAVQIPYKDSREPINSYTLSSAQDSGWIWDIGLSSRRGVGYTYSSKYCTDERAREELKAYVEKSGCGDNVESLTYKQIKFEPGYLEKFWHKNCLAVGVSSGFIEPLEASALVMIEMAANMLVENFPTTYEALATIEERYNKRFSRHWEHIIEFLKLHYVLSERSDTSYWCDNRREDTIPNQLTEKMNSWRLFPPSKYDEIGLQELFPIDSYQFVLHGMGYQPTSRGLKTKKGEEQLVRKIDKAMSVALQLSKRLPTNRELLAALKK